MKNVWIVIAAAGGLVLIFRGLIGVDTARSVGAGVAVILVAAALFWLIYRPKG